jgi:hypothetical protein
VLPPRDHQRDEVAPVVGPVQQPGTALIELSTAGGAPEAPLALGRAVPPLSRPGRTAVHALHSWPPAAH